VALTNEDKTEIQKMINAALAAKDKAAKAELASNPAETAKFLVKNVTDGPSGVLDANGNEVMIGPGKTETVLLPHSAVPVIARTGFKVTERAVK